MLPGLNGFVVARRLREAGRDVPILMLTAKDGDLDQAEALDTGADDFLAKPFSYPVLLARLRALIRRSSSRPSSVVDDRRPAHRRAGAPLLARRRRDRADRPRGRAARVPRPPRRRRRHQGRAAPPRLAATRTTDVNAVEVYIGYLRRKIDAPFGRTTIETVRGRGYRLADRRRVR